MDDYYYFGGVVRVNRERAIGFYQRAAEYGTVPSMTSFGYTFCYEDIELNEKKGMEWFERAAAMGDEDFYAETDLGLSYEVGTRVKKDTKKAMKW